MAGKFDIFTFLEEYKRWECLWKRSSPDFKSRVKRDHAEEALLPFSGLSTITELRKKIRNIRCTYNQEILKIKKSMGTHKPKLAWFSLADSFLRQNFEENDSKPSLNLPKYYLDIKAKNEVFLPFAEFDEDWVEESPDSAQLQDNDHTDDTDNESIPPNTKQESKLKIRKRKANAFHQPQRKIKVDKSLDNADNTVQAAETAEVLQVANQTSPFLTSSEFTVFGQHVAVQLQCLPLGEALKLQEEIQKLITAARLRCIESSNPQISNNRKLHNVDLL